MLIVVAQTYSSEASFLNAFYRTEPDFLHELVEVVNTESAIPQYIRVATIKALIALTTETSRLTMLLTITGCGVHHGILPTILRRAVATITSRNSYNLYNYLRLNTRCYLYS